MIRRIVTSLVIVAALCAFGQQSASAQDQRYTANPTQPFTKGPGGAKIGELYVNTPVTVLEQRGSWVRVTVEGWVRENSLATKQQAAAAAAGEARQLLEVTGYTTKYVTEGVPSPRVYVTLKIKNQGEHPIGAWDALLVGQSKSSGEVVFREPISDSGKTIAAGGAVEVTFFWEQREKPYEPLRSATEETLELRLYKVKAQ